VTPHFFPIASDSYRVEFALSLILTLSTEYSLISFREFEAKPDVSLPVKCTRGCMTRGNVGVE
jgi:hypothetical protein